MGFKVYIDARGIDCPLPDPPPGFRWELGGWMGSTMERPWPDLKPDPDVAITLPVSDWREIRASLTWLGQRRAVRMDSVMAEGALIAADKISRGLGLHVARCDAGRAECDPGRAECDR